jgi:hypothetical protein
VCTGWLKVQNLSTERRVEGLLVARSCTESKELKYLDVFEEVPQGVRAEVLLGGLSCEGSSRRVNACKLFKGR